MKIATNLILLLLSISALCATTIEIKRDNTHFREGPGAWYPVIETISKGTEMEQLLADEEDDYGQWLRVQLSLKEGYISKIATKDLPPKKDIFANMAKQSTSTSSSRHGVSAGVKGFGEKFSKSFKGDASFLEQAMFYQINPKEYKKFKKATYKDFSLRRNLNKIKLPLKEREEFFTEAERGLGLGISTVIAGQGLYPDKKLQDYVNYVGLQLVEAFELTEIEFKFFILSMPNPNAYATPGGVIFITKGMLELCNNEAELAVILAHEIVHVAYNHGMKEIVERRNHIAADNTFAELDREYAMYDEDTAAVEAELEEDAFQIYETLIAGRLDQYEKEADQVGMIVAARAGYDAKVLPIMLERIAKYTVKSNNEHYRPDIINQRKKWALAYLKDAKFPDNLMLQEQRFRSETVSK